MNLSSCEEVEATKIAKIFTKARGFKIAELSDSV